jgi:probable phosphoglycerate mutase
MRFPVTLVRHGETPWSVLGKHTGRTDVALTEVGRAMARGVGPRLAGGDFGVVWSSPLVRARETCELAGFGARVELAPDLMERHYGRIEGRTTHELRSEQPGWNVWTAECVDGESLAAVGLRADRVIDRLRASRGSALLFSHAHFLRILAARWIDLPALSGQNFVLETASISVLGWERETPAILSWNQHEPVPRPA